MADDLPGDVLRRHDLVAQALAEVEAALAAPAGADDWRERVEKSLHALREVGREQLDAFVGADGLLDRIVAADQGQAPRVDQLKARVPTLQQEMRATLAALEHGTPDDVREATIGLLVTVVRLRQQSADLLYETYWHDLGGRG
jgi:hypothetical protein